MATLENFLLVSPNIDAVSSLSQDAALCKVWLRCCLIINTRKHLAQSWEDGVLSRVLDL